jgi:hypothetical protein
MYAYALESIRVHREPLHVDLVNESTSCDVLRVMNRLYKLNTMGYSATILSGFFYIETLRDRLLDEEKDKLLVHVFGRERMRVFEAMAEEPPDKTSHCPSPVSVCEAFGR